jgi:serine/threonine protein phosphatase PrpC
MTNTVIPSDDTQSIPNERQELVDDDKHVATYATISNKKDDSGSMDGDNCTGSTTTYTYDDNDTSDYTSIPKGEMKSIRDIGFVEDQNARFRRSMEDGHTMIDGFRGLDYEGYFAIYDGHGGKTAVTHVQKVMYKIFAQELEKAYSSISEHSEAVRTAFENTYRRTDQELEEAQYNGTTAITCYITRNPKTNSRLLYTANCGDARVVLSENGIAKRLTFDHKANEESEIKRVKESNGFVAYNRVNGILAVTRALGDHAMKQWVISDPFQTCVELSDNSQFVILACDGLWDVFEDQECVSYVKDLFDNHNYSAQEVARSLLEKSLEKGSTDNISIMVIRL